MREREKRTGDREQGTGNRGFKSGAWGVWGVLVVGACGGEAVRAMEVPPVTVARPARRASQPVPVPLPDSRPPAVPPPLPVPVFGDGGVKPTDPHAVRIAISLKSARANASGVEMLKLLSTLPGIVDAKIRTGVDPFADGEWILAYGPRLETPWSNVNVLKHGRPDGVVADAIADAGLEPAEAGAGATWAEMFGVRDVLLRPAPGVLALVPSDRAAELAGALRAPIDHGVKSGEIARATFAEPAKVVRSLPPDLARGLVVARPASDGGLDLTGEAECPDAARCRTIATELDELVRRQNALVIRMVTKNVLGGLAFRGDGAKLRATLHATPEHIQVLINVARTQLP